MNHTVETNLLTIISTLEHGQRYTVTDIAARARRVPRVALHKVGAGRDHRW